MGSNYISEFGLVLPPLPVPAPLPAPLPEPLPSPQVIAVPKWVESAYEHSAFLHQLSGLSLITHCVFKIFLTPILIPRIIYTVLFVLLNLNPLNYKQITVSYGNYGRLVEPFGAYLFNPKYPLIISPLFSEIFSYSKLDVIFTYASSILIASIRTASNRTLLAIGFLYFLSGFAQLCLGYYIESKRGSNAATNSV